MNAHDFTDGLIERSTKGQPEAKAPEGKLTVIAPPKIQAMMTGTEYVEIYASGYCRLHYSDGTTEGAHLTTAALALGRQNYFALVGAVQDCRPNTQTTTKDQTT